MTRSTQRFTQLGSTSRLMLLLTLLSSSVTAHGAEMQVGTTLEDFFTAAIDYSPRLRISEEQYKIGTARKDAATGQLKPQISASATVTDNRRYIDDNLDKFDGERYSLQLNQVLFNWEAFATRRQANYVEDQTEAEYFYELSYLLTEIAERYFNVPQAQGELDSITAELDAVNNQLAQIQSLYDRQLAQITDLLQAQASVAAVEAEQIKLQSDLEISRESLSSASGLSVGELYTLRRGAGAPPLENDAKTWVDLAHANNLQIKASKFAREAATEGISRSKGAFMPNVSLILQRQDSDVGFDNSPQQQTDTTYVGIDFRIPIYSGGTRRASLREAKSMQSIAENELAQITLDTDELVRSAYLRYRASESFIAAAKILVESTAASADATQKGFELGTVTNVDVLNAIRDQYAAERRLQEARYQNIKFFLLLKRETGTLTADDMVEVSSWFSPANEVKVTSWFKAEDVNPFYP